MTPDDRCARCGHSRDAHTTSPTAPCAAGRCRCDAFRWDGIR